MMSDYCKFDQLGYMPSHGIAEIRGEDGMVFIKVSVGDGRDLEKAGIPVVWPYSTCPAWIADIGLAKPWMFLERILSWPSGYS